MVMEPTEAQGVASSGLEACRGEAVCSASRRRSQVVRQRSAKPLFVGSIPTGASLRNKDLRGSARTVWHIFWHIHPRKGWAAPSSRVSANEHQLRHFAPNAYQLAPLGSGTVDTELTQGLPRGADSLNEARRARRRGRR